MGLVSYLTCLWHGHRPVWIGALLVCTRCGKHER